MKRWVAFLHHASILAVGLSGLAYGVMKYSLHGSDPDSRVSHPWQQPALKIHVLTAPLLVFALGLLFSAHALARLKGGESPGRMSGAGLLGLAAPLILTGSLVQVLTAEAARQWTGWIHAGLGAVYLLGTLAHLLKKLPDDGVTDELARRTGGE